MQKPNKTTSHSDGRQQAYLGKVVLEQTNVVERVIKVEQRVFEGEVVIALIQSLRYASAGLPIVQQAQTRDILVAQPAAIIKLIFGLSDDDIWEKIKSYLTDEERAKLFPDERVSPLEDPTPPLIQ